MAAFATFAGAIINANIFGELAVLITQLSQKQQEFLKKIDDMNTAMKNIKLPQNIQAKVRDYLYSIKSSQDNQRELDLFLTSLSPSIKNQVLINQFSNIISNTEVFNNDLALIEKLVSKLQILMYFPEDDIIKQGEEGMNLYFLERGHVLVYQVDQINTKERRFISELKVGSMFGEIALVFECKRTANVISRNFSTCSAIDREEFNEVMQQYPSVLQKIKQSISEKYKDKIRSYLTVRFIILMGNNRCLVLSEENRVFQNN